MRRSRKKWKYCKECRVPKPIDEFFKTPAGAPKSKCKKCVRSYSKARYAARKEQEPYKKRHPNRERLMRIEEHRERARKWSMRNPEIYQAQQKAAEEREKKKGYPSAAKRRAIEFGVYDEDVNKRTLWSLYNGECGICGGEVKYMSMTIDHIIPLSKGGRHNYGNCQPAHATCNRRKADTIHE